MRVQTLAFWVWVPVVGLLGCEAEPAGPGSDGGGVMGSSGGASTGGTLAGSGGTSESGGTSASGGITAGGTAGAPTGSGGSGGTGAGGGSGGSGAAGGGGDAGGWIGTDSGSGAIYPAPGQRTGPGGLPARTARAPEYLGLMEFDDPRIKHTHAYSGVLDGQVVWTFGDTYFKHPDPRTDYAIVANATAGMGEMESPLRVHEVSVSTTGLPDQWVLMNEVFETGGEDAWSLASTNVVEFAPNQGLAWFLKIDRRSTTPTHVGAGVVGVTMRGLGPYARRNSAAVFAAHEPYWGDVGATYDPRDGHVYVFGHGPAELALTANVYLAKVPGASAMDLAAYRFWDQSTASWGSGRYGNGQDGTIAFGTAQALFTQAPHGASNAFWSNHYNSWMFVYGEDRANSPILVSTAPDLQGPWTAPFTIGDTCPNPPCTVKRFNIAPHPEFDASGKTLIVTWNEGLSMHATRVTWE